MYEQEGQSSRYKIMANMPVLNVGILNTTVGYVLREGQE